MVWSSIFFFFRLYRPGVNILHYTPKNIHTPSTSQVK